MSGLKIGDLVLDPRGLVFLPSQKVLVCFGLKQALSIKNSKIGKGVVERVDYAIKHHQPETLIILGPLEDELGLALISKRFGSKVRIVLVAANPSKDACAVAEALKFEVHQELVWDRYRFIERFENPVFVDSDDMQALDFQFLTIAGGADYYVRIGKAAYDPLGIFTGEKLHVFLRGLGRLKIPSLDPDHGLTSVFSVADDPFFDRYDVFAMGHSRILPLGKVTEIKKIALLDTIPVTKKALSGKTKKSAGVNPTIIN